MVFARRPAPAWLHAFRAASLEAAGVLTKGGPGQRGVSGDPKIGFGLSIGFPSPQKHPRALLPVNPRKPLESQTHTHTQPFFTCRVVAHLEQNDLKMKLEDDWPESIFPQALIQPRRHLFTSLRRACLRAAMLSVYGHMRAPSHHPTFLSNCAARFLTKVVCASCIVPGCCAQVALCKLLHAAARKCSVQVALRKCSEQVALRKCSAPVAPRKRFAHVLCASWSVQVALRQLLRASALRMCSVQVALRKCSEQVALRKCSVPVAPCKRFAHVLCASWSVQVALRKCFVHLLCASCSAQVALRRPAVAGSIRPWSAAAPT